MASIRKLAGVRQASSWSNWANGCGAFILAATTIFLAVAWGIHPYAHSGLHDGTRLVAVNRGFQCKNRQAYDERGCTSRYLTGCCTEKADHSCRTTKVSELPNCRSIGCRVFPRGIRGRLRRVVSTTFAYHDCGTELDDELDDDGDRGTEVLTMLCGFAVVDGDEDCVDDDLLPQLSFAPSGINGSSSYRHKCCDPGAVTGDYGCCDTTGVLEKAVHGGQLDCSHENFVRQQGMGVS